MRVPLLVVVVVLSSLACNTSRSSPPGPAPGTERGACYGNRTCNDGLSCLSDLCVRPPGADCGKVAAKLGSFMLGNYADRDLRDQYLARTRDECTAAQLTKEEGDCLLGAPHRNALGRCPKLVGAGDCEVIVAHLDKLRPTGDQYLVTAADKLQSRCKNEIPSKALEGCVLAAKMVSELDRCVW
jgi:hypothetical protein